ncbi:MAG: UDP-N-acetylmuramate dehydrogenase [Planctomycetes bacterium]|nr:UDP-N-acetylmuramate dehydrogenase [Planctomycetota bacterium]
MRIRRREPLRDKTSFHIGGPSRLFAEPETIDEFAALLAWVHRRGMRWFVLGGGTNTLFEDGGFDGVVISTARLQRLRVVEEGLLAAEAGVSLRRMIKHAIGLGWEGLERFVGIPGSIGGAVWGNAGGAERAIGEVVEAVVLLDSDGTRRCLPGDQIDWCYRSSGIGARGIAEVYFRLCPGSRAALVKMARAIIQRKGRTQPLKARSAGCIFRNPGGASAARLIDEAGLKGVRIGGAAVSDLHANFIVNEREATARDVFDLMDLVRSRVLAQFGCELEREVVSPCSGALIGIG